MNADFIVFPAPKCSYDKDDELLGKLLMIPKLKGCYPDKVDRKTMSRPNVSQIVKDSDEIPSNSPKPLKSKGSTSIRVIHHQRRQVIQPEDISSDSSATPPSNRIPGLNLQCFQVKAFRKIELESKRYNAQQVAQHRKVLKEPVMPQHLKSRDTSPLTARTDRSFVTSDSIPCLYIKTTTTQPNLILYFHGNAVDIKLASYQVFKLVHQLQISALLIEYPGYGLYPDQKNKGQTICWDAQYIYQYLIHMVGYKENNLLVIGRSIGSGPATHIANLFKPACLILISPFTSIRDVVGFLATRLISKLIDERFDNLEKIRKVSSPVFILHGRRDTIIPFQQSQILIDAAATSAKTHFQISDEMDHERFQFMEDLIRPLVEFLFQSGFQFIGGSEPEFPQSCVQL